MAAVIRMKEEKWRWVDSAGDEKELLHFCALCGDSWNSI